MLSKKYLKRAQNLSALRQFELPFSQPPHSLPDVTLESNISEPSSTTNITASQATFHQHQRNGASQQPRNRNSNKSATSSYASSASDTATGASSPTSPSSLPFTKLSPPSPSPLAARSAFSQASADHDITSPSSPWYMQSPTGIFFLYSFHLSQIVFSCKFFVLTSVSFFFFGKKGAVGGAIMKSYERLGSFPYRNRKEWAERRSSSDALTLSLHASLYPSDSASITGSSSDNNTHAPPSSFSTATTVPSNESTHAHISAPTNENTHAHISSVTPATPVSATGAGATAAAASDKPKSTLLRSWTVRSDARASQQPEGSPVRISIRSSEIDTGKLCYTLTPLSHIHSKHALARTRAPLTYKIFD